MSPKSPIINSLSALTLHLNPSLVFLIFGIKFHLTEVLEQTGSGFPALNAMGIRLTYLIAFINHYSPRKTKWRWNIGSVQHVSTYVRMFFCHRSSAYNY